MIAKHLNAELPFMATEKILMLAVKKGGDRQELHEREPPTSRLSGVRSNRLSYKPISWPEANRLPLSP